MDDIKPTIRKFMLADAMILIAALAVGFIAARPHFPHLRSNLEYLWRQSRNATDSQFQFLLFGGPRLADSIALATVQFLFPILVCWTAGLLAIRLCRPRPQWRVLARQAGLWSCLAPLAAQFTILWWDGLGVRLPSAVYPGAVALAWLSLAVSRQWRSERSWIDRAGRSTGLVWLTTALVWIRWGDVLGIDISIPA